MKNWEVKKLGDVCSFFNGQAHEKVIDESGKYKLINSKFVSSEGEKFKRTNNALSPLFINDIVMVMSDVPNGKTLAKCFVVDKDDTYTLNQRICVIRSKNFDTRFLYYQLNRNKYLLSFNNGENQSNLRKDDILNCELFVPTLQEQQRIVAILDEVFAAIAKAKVNVEQNLKNAKELFENYMQGVFENKGDNWEEKTLGEIADVEYGYTDKSTEEGDYRYIRITDIDKNGELILDDKKYINHSKEAEGFLIQDNDLLMARTGATFAKVLLYNGDEPSVFASYLIRIKFKEKIENALYWYFTKTKYYWEQANSLQSGAAQPHFNGAAVKKVIFSYPKSTKEQKVLIEKFETLSVETKKLEAIYQSKINDLEELKKSVLQKAFSGELKQN
jgi:type I restriction enzyme S subunit